MFMCARQRDVEGRANKTNIEREDIEHYGILSKTFQNLFGSFRRRLVLNENDENEGAGG